MLATPNFDHRLLTPLRLALGFATQSSHACAVLGVCLAASFASFSLARAASEEPPRDRTREIERLIDGLASHNEAPKLVGDTPIFSENFDWGDRKRVQAVAWALSQDDSNDLWGHLVEHFHDTRYSATNPASDGTPINDDVGIVCWFIAKNKLICAYLRHLEPRKTYPYSPNIGTAISEYTTEYLPGSVQEDLHYHYQYSSFRSDHPNLAEWYQARKTKPFYELQIEACEWAIKRVQDARSAADKSKSEFIAAVKKEIESLKKNKRPVADPSKWASPLNLLWRSYTPADAKYYRQRYLEELRKEKKGRS
jgi:hypothetical protein